ncbi:DUF6250 domain-containing protein [Sphingomonas cannabina]|uniref:DUF6250 domain-containing protein n=1 Tax=Sphingomonas cannabina TaxID=2899123 RepID=UPI0029E8184E|nr:DUF6250 domain-containing protein [Sphingomonas cannabina]
MLRDDFRRDLSQWAVEAERPAKVSVRDGILDIDAPAGITLWFRPELQAPVTIDYRVLAVAEDGPNDAVSDVNAFWMATDPAAPDESVLDRPRSGAFAEYDTLRTYYVGIGGNRNTTTRLRRYVGRAGDRPILPQHDRSDRAALLEPNRWTHVRLIADGRHIAVERDGKLLFALDDAEPYLHGHFGLRTTKSHLRIRDFTVRTA